MPMRLSGNSKYDAAKKGFIDEESLRFMELNLESKFGASNRTKSKSSSANTSSGSKWPQTFKAFKSSAETGPQGLRLEIKNTRNTQLSQIPVINNSVSATIEISPERLKVPTKEELEARKRSGMTSKAFSSKHPLMERKAQLNAPPVPKPPSVPISKRRIEELREKIKTKVELANLKDAKKPPKMLKLKTASLYIPSRRPPEVYEPKTLPGPQILPKVESINKFSHDSEPSGETNFDFADFLAQSEAEDQGKSNPSLLKYIERKRSRNPLSKSCIVCNLEMDSMYTLKHTEVLVPLVCGHFAHENCLSMEVELMLGKYVDHNREKVQFFPACALCKERAAPVDQEDLNNILSMGISGSFSKNYCLPLSPTLFPAKSKVVEEKTKQEENSIQPTKSDSEIEVTATRPTEELQMPDSIAIPVRSSQASPPQLSLKKINHLHEQKKRLAKGHIRQQSRGSAVPAISMVVSSAQKYAIPQSLMRMPNWTTEYTTQGLAQRFADDLIKLSQEETIKPFEVANFVTMFSLLTSYGTIRMADKMLAKGENEDEFKEYYCFLCPATIVFVQLASGMFTVKQLSYLSYCELDDDDILHLKSTSKSEDVWQMDSNVDELTRKWEVAITDPSIPIDNTVITNTIKKDEFEHLFKTKPRYNEIGQRRTTVDTRFCTSFFDNIVFANKPNRIILVLNQFPYSVATTQAMKNIIQALHIIKINIDLVLVSAKFIKVDTYVLSHKTLSASDGENDLKSFLQLLDHFESTFYEENDDYEITLDTIEDTIIKIMHSNSVCKTDDIHTVLLSNASLKNVGPLPTKRSIMLEIGLLDENKSFRSNVVDLANWEGVMEVICDNCLLEFDESDLEFSDVDSAGFDILRSDGSVITCLDKADCGVKERSPIDNVSATLTVDNTPCISTLSQIQNHSPTVSLKLNLSGKNTKNHSLTQVGDLIGLLNMELEKYEPVQ